MLSTQEQYCEFSGIKSDIFIFVFSLRKVSEAEDGESGAGGRVRSSYGSSAGAETLLSYGRSFAEEGGDPGGEDPDREQDGQNCGREEPRQEDPQRERERRDRYRRDASFAAFHFGTFFPFTGYAARGARVPY